MIPLGAGGYFCYLLVMLLMAIDTRYVPTKGALHTTINFKLRDDSDEALRPSGLHLARPGNESKARSIVRQHSRNVPKSLIVFRADKHTQTKRPIVLCVIVLRA
jgi:hypothetical protein